MTLGIVKHTKSALEVHRLSSSLGRLLALSAHLPNEVLQQVAVKFTDLVHYLALCLWIDILRDVVDHGRCKNFPSST